jgi:hypothetical protein
MKRMIVGFTALFAGCAAASAQFTNKSDVLDGSGTVSSNGALANISASGQPGGISVSIAGGYVNQAGFLNTFFLKPGLLSAHGIPVEIDPDNDADGLADTAEIMGSSFTPATITNPNLADTDGDGISDAAEAIAGTDPTDSGSSLVFVRIANASPGNAVSWVARSNKQYRVRYSDNSYTYPTNILTTVTASGFANAPWYVTTNSLTDVTVTNARFFAVEPLP